MNSQNKQGGSWPIRMLIVSTMYNNTCKLQYCKQLLDEVFVISRIIKVKVKAEADNPY